MLRVAGVLFTVALCSAQATSFPTWRLAEAPDEMKPAIQRAELIIVELQGAMLAELTRTLQASGESGAMRSCHLDAIALAQRIGRQSGIAVGRTSDRLRSPTNAPRPWTRAIVTRFAGARASDVGSYAVDLGDHIGVLRPITTGRMCSGCHGPAEQLSPAVRAQLGERYPADHAVGFREGDLRGWFWVEVPRQP